MKRWLIAALVLALLSGMACGVAEEGGEAEAPAPVEAAPEPAQEAPKQEVPKQEVPKQEAPKQEVKEEPKAETKSETKSETKAETKSEPKAETKSEPKAETKSETKAETKEENKAETKTETKEEPKAETKEEPKAETKEETKEESKAETKEEPKAEPEAQPEPEAKPETVEADEEKSSEPQAEEASPAVEQEAPEAVAETPAVVEDAVEAPDEVLEAQPEAAEPERSDKVARVQRWLVKLDYLTGAYESGVYDGPTRKAVTRFQSDNGLTASGECDDATYDLLKRLAEGGAIEEATVVTSDAGALEAETETTEGNDSGDAQASAPTSENDEGGDDQGETAPDYPVEDGETDDQRAETVTRIQAWLVKLGYLSEDETFAPGSYDDATRAAVKAFQLANSLTDDGRCVDDTYALLLSLAGEDADDAATDDTQTPQPAQDAQNPGAPADNGENPNNSENPDAKNGMPGRGGFGGGFGGGRRGGGFKGAAGAGAMGDMEEEQGDDRLNGVTPGEALSSSHASGDKDTTPYGVLDVAESLSELDFKADGGDKYDYEISGGSLTLSGGDRWTFTGASLRTLSVSGVDQLVLSGSGSARLETDIRFTGKAYDALRSKGYTDNTFVYDVALSDGEAQISVTAGGRSYRLGADGTLTPNE